MNKKVKVRNGSVRSISATMNGAGDVYLTLEDAGGGDNGWATFRVPEALELAHEILEVVRTALATPSARAAKKEPA